MSIVVKINSFCFGLKLINLYNINELSNKLNN